jgi:hypothetical protein
MGPIGGRRLRGVVADARSERHGTAGYGSGPACGSPRMDNVEVSLRGLASESSAFVHTDKAKEGIDRC